MKDSESAKKMVIYWRSRFRTDRLQKLCAWSKAKDWQKYAKKQFVRRAHCRDLNDFRFAIVEEIRRLRKKFANDEQRGLERLTRSMKPWPRQKRQKRHELQPIAVLWRLLADLRIGSEKVLEHASRWDKEVRKVATRNIEKTVVFLKDLQRKLQP